MREEKRFPYILDMKNLFFIFYLVVDAIEYHHRTGRVVHMKKKHIYNMHKLIGFILLNAISIVWYIRCVYGIDKRKSNYRIYSIHVADIDTKSRINNCGHMFFGSEIKLWENKKIHINSSNEKKKRKLWTKPLPPPLNRRLILISQTPFLFGGMKKRKLDLSNGVVLLSILCFVHRLYR